MRRALPSVLLMALWMVSACAPPAGKTSGGGRAADTDVRGRAHAVGKEKMPINELVPLYQWVRTGASIYLGAIAAIRTEQSAPDFELVTIDVAVEEVLWGEKGARRRRCKFERPTGDLARARFPDPVWDAIDLKNGTRLLLVTRARDEAPTPADFAQAFDDPRGPVLQAMRDLFDEERKPAAPSARLAQYLHWLRAGAIVQRLFAGEAVARDSLPGTHDTEAAEALAQAFVSSDNPFAQIALAGWIWDQLYERTTREGRVAIVNATVQVTRGPREASRRYAQDRLAGAGPLVLAQEGVRKDAEAAALLRKRAEAESSTSLRQEILTVANALQP